MNVFNMDMFASISKQLSRRHIEFYATTEEQRLSVLEPIEQKYVEGSTFKRRNEFATGRWCAKQAMLKLGISTNAIFMGSNNEPIWRNDITGSITHTNNAFCAAVACKNDLHSIGIDIEERKRKISPDALALIFNDDEKMWISQTGKRRRFYEILVFSAKESIFKMISPILNEKFSIDVVSISRPVSLPIRILMKSVIFSEMRAKFPFFRSRGILSAQLMTDLGNGFSLNDKFEVYYFFNRKWIVTAAYIQTCKNSEFSAPNLL